MPALELDSCFGGWHTACDNGKPNKGRLRRFFWHLRTIRCYCPCHDGSPEDEL